MSFLDAILHREPSAVGATYYGKSVTVAGGVVNQEVDLAAALATAGRPAAIGPARYVAITTDVAITVRLNSPTADAWAVSSTVPLTIPLNVLAISKLYLSHSGACGAGSATVKIFAA
jgi:hypothetical protein